MMDNTDAKIASPRPSPSKGEEAFLHLLSLAGTGHAFNHSFDDSSIASIFSL